MTVIEKSVEIKAPLEKVWRVLTDLDRFHEWAKAVKMKLASGKQGLGATYHTTAKFLGMEFDIDQECTEWLENRKWTYSMSFSGKESKISFILKPTKLGTKLTEVIDYELPYSYLGKILDKVAIRKHMEKFAKEELENLKKYLGRLKGGEKVYKKAGDPNKLSISALAIIGSVVWGLYLFIAALFASVNIEILWFSNEVFVLVSSIYLGLSATIGGAFIGLIWGLACGAFCGGVFGSLYNFLVDCFKFTRRI